VSRGEEHGWVKGTCRYPQELLVKCRLKVLAWEGKESMQLSADDISASHNVVLRRAPIVFLGPEHTRFPLRSLRRGAEQAQKKSVEQLVEQTWNRTGGNRVKYGVSGYS
jgi:hypothetical protein